MTFKFEGWCGSDRCQKISIAGRKLEINNQQATLNTLAYIKARTISPKGNSWNRSSKITSRRISLAHTTLPPVQWIVLTIVYRALLIIMENAQRRLYKSQHELIQLNTRLPADSIFLSCRTCCVELPP